MSETILITGASRGIGLELARAYAARGWRVHACCRKPAEAAGLAALADANEGVSVWPLDVADPAAIERLAKDALRDAAIDVLLNNAGLYGRKGLGIGGFDQAEWLQVLAVNTVGPALVAQAFLPHVLRGERRIIATLSSKVGSLAENTSGRNHPYRSSKAGVNQVMKSLAIELAGEGVIAVALHPGWVQTEMGGPNALISAAESVAGLIQVLDSLSPEQSGAFLDYQATSSPGRASARAIHELPAAGAVVVRSKPGTLIEYHGSALPCWVPVFAPHAPYQRQAPWWFIASGRVLR